MFPRFVAPTRLHRRRTINEVEQGGSGWDEDADANAYTCMWFFNVHSDGDADDRLKQPTCNTIDQSPLIMTTTSSTANTQPPIPGTRMP